jgi:hypothetical protein
MKRSAFVSGLAVIAQLSIAAAAHSQSSQLPGRVIDIKVGEYFINAPDSAPAGLVTLRVTQTGDVTKPFPADTAKLQADLTYHFHMVWLVRLDSARTFTDLLQAERDGKPHTWAKIQGGAGFADVPGSSNVTMLLTPGNYALVCYVGSAREDRNRYHLLKGMIAPLTITARPNADQLPATNLTVVLGGDSIIAPDTLAAGTHRILVQNNGVRVSDLGIARLKPGYTVEQAIAWRPRTLTEPPRHAVGGVVYVKSDRPLITTVTLQPGDYFFGGKHVAVR